MPLQCFAMAEEFKGRKLSYLIHVMGMSCKEVVDLPISPKGERGRLGDCSKLIEGNGFL